MKKIQFQPIFRHDSNFSIKNPISGTQSVCHYINVSTFIRRDTNSAKKLHNFLLRLDWMFFYTLKTREIDKRCFHAGCKFFLLISDSRETRKNSQKKSDIFLRFIYKWQQKNLKNIITKRNKNAMFSLFLIKSLERKNYFKSGKKYILQYF